MAGGSFKSITAQASSFATHCKGATDDRMSPQAVQHERNTVIINITSSDGSTGKGILIGMLSAFGSAALVVLVFAIFYLFRHTNRGRILLERLGRPGEYDDEQALAREEAEALEGMDDLRRIEYLRAKGTLQPSCFGVIFRLVLTLLIFCKLSYRRTRRRQCKPKSHFLNTSRFRKRAFQRGSLSQSSKLPTAL